ncbi:MAG: hypothetical protein JNN18_23170 [Rubrivivax sp.]|nr:hypothetical protein [Rubrivivax sp.]
MPDRSDTLPQSWLKHANGIGITGQSMPLLSQLVARWSEPHRHCHTLRHLQECLQLLEEWGRAHPLRHEIGMALWFHDAIHDPARPDNEERSARLATRALGRAGADPERVRIVSRFVRATRHGARTRSAQGAELMLDIDLAILGADRARFEAYERQVRAEYAHVPDDDFARGRAAFVDAMRERPRLFMTEPGQRLEARARENLQRSSLRWHRMATRA